MAIRVVRLGSPRTVDEGLRLGTVRRPPRGSQMSVASLARMAGVTSLESNSRSPAARTLIVDADASMTSTAPCRTISRI